MESLNGSEIGPGVVDHLSLKHTDPQTIQRLERTHSYAFYKHLPNIVIPSHHSSNLYTIS